MSSDIAIKVENLSKCYQIYGQPHDRLKQLIYPRVQRLVGKQPKHYFREFWALNDVSFEIKRGETIGILGRNGSGKSTLLQIIAGTLSPTSGEIYTSGVLAALLELGSGFNPEFSGRENVYLNGSILGFTRQEIDARFDRIVSFADIGEHLEQPVKTYSSGMAVRLAFAVQACVDPQILIVDEALSVGDEKFQRKCFDYIERLRTNGCSILLVTHSTATVEKFCQRGVLLHKGEVHGIGPAKEIVDQYHALLYSDERAYLRYLNPNKKNRDKIDTQSTPQAESMALGKAADISMNQVGADDTGLRAIIKSWEILDKDGEYSESFTTGEWARIRFFVDVLGSIKELQAGILIRTVEGVSVFGTSTLYHGKNYLDVKSGMSLQFDFDLVLNLCPGTYFVTLAIAEAITHGDMFYLDRKTDVVVIKVSQLRQIGSGIAMLDTTVSASQLGAKQ